MFAYIKGKLAYKHNDYLVVDVNGIGYKVLTALSTIEAAGSVGEEIKLYTYLYVREDIIALYGFITHEELGMFELLISVSGVGPKAALSLLSSISPSKFGLAVITDDVKTLTIAQGIGKKTGQRIILELKDKIKDNQLVASDSREGTMASADSSNSKIAEAISALMVLGYTAIESNKAVAAVYSEDMDLESIIRDSLKQMSK
ncbi:MAG: Holliday junction branch migration protein RuvA [Acetivibrionales bacterium]